MTAAFDWWLLEQLAEKDPVSPPLLAREAQIDGDHITRRLEYLRKRDLARCYYASRPVQWGITEAGRECLAISIDTSKSGPSTWESDRYNEDV